MRMLDGSARHHGFQRSGAGMGGGARDFFLTFKLGNCDLIVFIKMMSRAVQFRTAYNSFQPFLKSRNI
jgi:hypothetical protein